MRAALLFLFAAAGVFPASGQTAAAARSVVSVQVPAMANPYLAGLPDGTGSTYGDRAPEQSPVMVVSYLGNATYVSFRATGLAQHHPLRPPKYDPPNGSIAVNHGGEHGLSAVTAPIDSLVGVFLGEEQSDQSQAPPPVDIRKAGWNFVSLEPQLKQVFFIGTGEVKAKVAGSARKQTVARRFLVPKGATRLFLGVMDEYEWNNNEGYFDVTVMIERADATSNLFSVDSSVAFAKWACLPDRVRCTPDRGMVEPKGPNQYHVILPAHIEWAVSVPNPEGAKVGIHQASGTVCLEALPASAAACNGPSGNGQRAGAGFLAPDETAGELIAKIASGRTYFSVNGRGGPAFQKGEGYFEFDVTIQ